MVVVGQWGRFAGVVLVRWLVVWSMNIVFNSRSIWRVNMSSIGFTQSLRTSAVLLALAGGWLGMTAFVRGDEPAPDAKAKPATKATSAEPTTSIGIAANYPEAFAAAADYSAKLSGRAVLVMHKGEVIFERYDNGWKGSSPHPLASGTKSFTGVAAMFAIQDGLFTLDEKVCDTITEWKSDPAKSQITVRHLLTLSSGLQPDSNPGRKKGSAILGDGGKPGFEGAVDREDRSDWFMQAINAPMTGKPGAQFAYGGNHFYAFGEFLERKLKASDQKSKTAWDYYSEKIFTPIGMKVGFIGRDKKGHPNLPGGAMLSANEWAKFGQFVLQDGAWKQADGTMKQLIKPELFTQCFKPSEHNSNYGLTFWLRTSRPGVDDIADTGTQPAAPSAEQPDAKPPAKNGKPAADAPAGTLRDRIRERLQRKSFDDQSAPIVAPDGKPVEVRMAAGLGKQRLLVLPQYDLVVVRFAESTAQGAKYDDREFLKPIIEALNKEMPALKDATKGQ